MTTTIKSQSGRKEAVITSSVNSGYRATINQVVFNGFEIDRDFVQTKNGFKSYLSAEKWAKSNIN